MKGSVRREQSFDTAESETLGMCGNSMGENREALQTPALDGSVGRSKKAKGRKVDMHVCGESDGLVVSGTGQTGDVLVFGLHALLRGDSEGSVYDQAAVHGQAHAREANGDQSAAQKADAQHGGRNGRVAAVGSSGLAQLSCGTWK